MYLGSFFDPDMQIKKAKPTVTLEIENILQILHTQSYRIALYILYHIAALEAPIPQEFQTLWSYKCIVLLEVISSSNVMRQSACLVFNPIMVDNYAAFFNCTPVGRASDSMMAPT